MLVKDNVLVVLRALACDHQFMSLKSKSSALCLIVFFVVSMIGRSSEAQSELKIEGQESQVLQPLDFDAKTSLRETPEVDAEYEAMLLDPDVHPDMKRKAKPKYEAGAFFGYFYLPAYPGSSVMKSRALPLPYLMYRGEVLRVDRENGILGRFMKKSAVEFDVSFGAAFPADAEDVAARAGMPDLDWLGEFGPRVMVHLKRGRDYKLDLLFPVRGAFSTDFSQINGRGFIFHPEISYEYYKVFRVPVVFEAHAGPVWVTENMADYFFQVDPQYATASRPEFDAAGGYWGFSYRAIVVSQLKDQFYVFFGMAQNQYGAAKNRRSPLLEDKTTESYYFGLSYGLYSSAQLEVLGE
jgi:outer membrane protein